MQISVTGQQIDIGDALRSHVQKRIANSVTKYFDNAINAHVAFSHEGALFRAQVRVHVGKGMDPRLRIPGNPRIPRKLPGSPDSFGLN